MSNVPRVPFIKERFVLGVVVVYGCPIVAASNNPERCVYKYVVSLIFTPLAKACEQFITPLSPWYEYSKKFPGDPESYFTACPYPFVSVVLIKFKFCAM